MLSEDIDPAETRVETVGERKVDQAISTAKRNNRLGSVSRQWIQALTLASGQNERQSARRDPIR